MNTTTICRDIVGVVFLICVSLAVSAGARSRVLTAADSQPPHYPTVRGLRFMRRELKNFSHGGLSIRIYPSGQLGGEQSVLELVRAGAIDIARVSDAPLADFDPRMGVLSLPYLFKNKKSYWQILRGPIGRELLDSLKSVRMLGLAYYDSGQRSFYTTRRAGPIRSIRDLKGLRVRVQKSQTMIAMVKALGATPVPMAFGDVYSALQTGVIDGAENNLPSYGPYGVRHYEVAPNYAFDSHSRVPEVVVVSLKTWKTLSPQQQRWLRKAALASVSVEKSAWAHLVAKTRKALQGKANFYHVDISRFQQAMGPVYAKYKRRYGNLIERILDAQRSSEK